MTPGLVLSAGMATSTPTPSTAQRIRVAIIGGGSAGAAACHELLQRNARSDGPSRLVFDPVVFERRNVAGGIWNFDASPGPCILRYDEKGKPWPTWSRSADDDREPGPMYDGLRTNIPSDVMSYRDEPIFDHHTAQKADTTDPVDNMLFPSRGQVNDYLQSFVKRHKLESYTRYGTRVVNVRRRDEHRSGSGWIVASEPATSTDGAELRKESFDKVILASGRCNLPNVPAIPGLKHFKGTILHSAWYRDPRDFVGKRVVVVGNNSSGMDICRELNGYVVREGELPGFSREAWAASRGLSKWAGSRGAGQVGDTPPAQITVIQSVEDITKPPPMDFDPRDPESPEWCQRIQVVPRIVEVRDGPGNGVLVLEDGQELEGIDVVIFATGFLLQFPYLDAESEPFISFPPVAPVLRPPAGGDARPSPAGPSLANFDDFLLLYRPDDSLAVLGAPVSIVPFPVAQLQSRYLAAYWSDLAAPLPVLSPEYAPSQPERWSTHSADPEGDVRRSQNQPQACMVGNPSDAKYLETILGHIHPSARPSGSSTVKEGVEAAAPWPPAPCPSGQAFTSASDGKGNGPRSGEEGWYAVAAWRRERRTNGKTLRREALGY